MSLKERAKYVVSADYRRWRRLLDSLTLDPAGVPEVDLRVGPRDFIICGPPRSGTALATAVLHQPPSVVTVMEPWDGMRLPPRALFESLREEMANGVLGRGRLDTAALRDGEVRWCRDGEKPVPVDYSEDTLVGVKWPGFWRYLDRPVTARFVVCLRHPVELLRSFIGTEGRLAEGLEYDSAFFRDLNEELLAATSDPTIRRVMLLERILGGIVPHLERPDVHVLRYERWFTDAAATRAELAGFLGVDSLEDTAITIRPPKSSAPVVAAEEDELLRRYAPTALELGYRW